MKRRILLTVAALGALTFAQANDGQVVFDAHCKACHALKMPLDKSKLMAMSKQERMAAIQEAKSKLKAPPMNKISAKLRHDFKGDNAAAVAFIKDYIVNPDASKSHCMPQALKRFGTMPPIGKTMKVEDIDAVAKWVVEHFTEKWDDMAMGQACKSDMAKQGGMMKCQGGKCGGAMKTPKKEDAPKMMKCGMGKCGGGKCGGSK